MRPKTHMPRPQRRRERRSRLTPRLKVWLETDGRYSFGFGICQILSAVDQTGSIKQAAAQLGKSYRYVWSRVKEAEAALGDPLVETHVGGRGRQRSSLTDRARRLLDDFLALRRRMAAVVDREFSRRFR